MSGPERALEARYYTDPGILEREKEAVFFKSWLFAGHLSQVARPGDYVTVEILGQSLIVIRGLDERLRCFFNVCQHRGHELLQGAGRKRLITCPYHAWSYTTDGKLKRAPGADKTEGFDAGAICLTEVRTETLCGFVFVNLDDQAPAMAALFPGVEAELREYLPEIDTLAPAHSVEVEEDCNWKVAVENYNECYHCRIAHPTFARGVVAPESYRIEPQGHCLRHSAQSAPAETLTYAYDAAATAHARDYSSWFLWPAFSFQVYPGGVLNTYCWRPLGPARTRVIRGWYAPGGEAGEALLKLAEQDRTTTMAEDSKLISAVQRGLASRGYRPGPLVIDPEHGINSEHTVREIKGWLLGALGD